MKKILKLSLLSALFLFAACSEDFIDVTPTEFISVDDVGETGKINPKIFDATLAGMYSMMYTTGTGGTSSHEDFGQKGYDMESDFLSGDMALTRGGFNRYVGFNQFLETVDYTYLRNYRPWRYYYRIIRSANLIIQSLGGNDAVLEKDEQKYVMGQAKTMRAYAYFNLTQRYVREYTPDSKVVAIINDPDQEDTSQSTTKEVYDFIIDDLTKSIALLDGFSRPGLYAVNKDVASAFLAYAYAAMGDYANALPHAENALANYTIMSGAQVTGGFNNVDNYDWMWGVNLTSAQELDLISWWGQMDYFTFSYQSYGNVKAMDAGLYSQIPADDLRKDQFLNAPGTWSLIPYNKFYDENRVFRGQRVIEADYVYMRVEEMYLLAAESAAKSGNEALARTYLKNVLEERVPSVTYVDALTGKDLEDEIYLQTRIELWGEGKSYFALKRNKANVVRGANHLSNVGTPIPHNDDRLTYKIPQSEVQNNPFMEFPDN